MTAKKLLFIILLAISQYACITTPTISYFDSADSTKYQLLPQNSPEVSTIRPDDILAVTIGSLNQESNEILNFNNINSLFTTSFPNNSGGGMRGQPLGFLVDPVGNIEIPLVGTIAVKGLKLDEAASKIKIEVAKLLKEPSVSVRFLNHKFSILGEVNRPGVYNLLNDKTTLPEALAMAGDLTVYGNRQSIMFIRDFSGKREQVRIDLRNKEIFNSPYYYLKDGDLIYIEPFKAKATYTEQKVQLAPLYISIATSAVSIVALITNILK